MLYNILYFIVRLLYRDCVQVTLMHAADYTVAVT